MLEKKKKKKKAEKNTIQVRWAILYYGVYFEVSTFKIPSYLL